MSALSQTDGPHSHDDGLGAFRPSTSFNDLTTLLPTTPSTATTAPQNSATLGSVTSAPLAAQGIIPTKKRSMEGAPSELPASKRRSSTSRKNGSASNSNSAKNKAKGSIGLGVNQREKKGSSRAKSQAAGKANQKKNDTPNPLTIGKPSSMGAKSSKKKDVSPPIVTPRLPDSANAALVSASAPPALANPPTEADFKSVAQAAVSNLIMNAGNLTKSDSANAATSTDSSGKVDTSTEHIKALTGSNWVAVCAGNDAGSASNANADKMNNRARRQNLTTEERARQNRDRNREHARNTRLRKKAYVEELKRTLTALVSQRDNAEVEKRHSAQRELEQREVRFRVIEEFLKLRGRNEINFARWAAILEETFTLTLPVTDFRDMVHPEMKNRFEQILSGVPETMRDSNLLAAFVQSLPKPHGKGSAVLSYNCDRKNFFMDNCNAVLDWTASTHGDLKSGLTMKGNLKANFSPASNKLISVTMTFDTGVLLSQINHIFKASQGCNEEAAAAQAACEADAILDSLQMPSVPSNVTVMPSVVSAGAASITDVEKEDSSDGSNGDSEEEVDTRALLTSNNA